MSCDEPFEKTICSAFGLGSEDSAAVSPEMNSIPLTFSAFANATVSFGCASVLSAAAQYVLMYGSIARAAGCPAIAELADSDAAVTGAGRAGLPVTDCTRLLIALRTWG